MFWFFVRHLTNESIKHERVWSVECGVWIVCLCLCAKCLCLATLCLYFICLKILKIYIYVVRSYGTQTVIKSQTNKPQQELVAQCERPCTDTLCQAIREWGKETEKQEIKTIIIYAIIILVHGINGSPVAVVFAGRLVRSFVRTLFWQKQQIEHRFR